MSFRNDGALPLITRRDLLSHAARGALVASIVPHLGLSQRVPSGSGDSTRSRESFDLGWKFLKGDADGGQRPDFADKGWRDVDLPHDWSIEGPFDEHAAAGGAGAYLPTGIGWYRKNFRLSEAQREKIITLEFDGVYQNSEVWINGVCLGLRPYGYVPFVYELTPHLRFNGENIVAVRVDNSRQTNSRWYSGSGIYRHTWINATNPLRVAQWGTFVTTPRITKSAATVQVISKILNGLKSDELCTLGTSILDRSGHEVQSSETSRSIAQGSEYEFDQQLVLEQPRLWSPSDPYLYTARTIVHTGDRVVDVYDTPFGIREAVFDVNRGFMLNGEHIKLNGVCLHHEAGSVGAAVPEAVWKRRLETLREMGCNAIRTSHNPYAAEFLDLCDRMGFLVMAEAFDEWRVPKGHVGNGYSVYFNDWYERDLDNILRRDRNHPSIVLWSAGNEIGDQSEPNGAETLRELLRVFHREDPTRPVTAGCDRIASDPATNTARPEFLAALDIVGYNYVDRWHERAEKYYSIDREAFPQRRFIGTESSGMGTIRGDYSSLFHDPGQRNHQRRMFEGNVDINVENLWKFVRTYDYVAGDFMWTGIDYLGESFWPMKSAFAGVIDTCGFKKDGFYFYQSQWTEKPMLHLCPHWSWQGREGQVIPVTCYTNCDTVELFLNGRSLGIKGYQFPRLGMEGSYGNFPERAKALRTTGDLHLSWDVPYEAGTLRAVGMKDGKASATEEISTAGAPATLSLSVDRARLDADRRDVAHLVVEVLDARGHIVPMADNLVEFALEGEGKLIGVDNGDPFSHEDYKADRRKAFNGKCLAIVQSTSKAGNILLKASSGNLRASSVSIETHL